MPRRIRLCVNGMTENDQIRGPVRYIYELMFHLDTALFDVVLIAGIWQKDIYQSLESRITVLYYGINRNKVSRALFSSFFVPWVLRSHHIDVYHIPDTNPFPLFRFGVSVVSTIHDVAEYVVPHRFTKVQAIYRRVISRVQAHWSNFLITDSEASKADIAKYLDIKVDAIEVIYLGAPPVRGSQEKVNTILNHPETPYILYVGVLENAKNVDRLVEAFGRLPSKTRHAVRLCLVGRKGNAYPRIAELIQDFQIGSDVDIFGYVDNQRLDELYRGAMVFAYLSEYEGFGLPVIEAMRYGLPVLTSNRSSLPEVAGSAALVVESDVQSILTGLERLLTDEDLRRKLSANGVARAAKFDWAETARRTQEIYLQAANSLLPTSREHASAHTK